MDWRPVQDVPRLSANGSWDRLQRPLNPELDEVGLQDGWIKHKI